MLGASGPSGHDAGADNIAVEKIKLELVSTEVIPGAAGEVELELRPDSDHGDAKIEARARAENLAPTAVYTLYVDRKFVGGEHADDQGRVDLGDDVTSLA